MATDAASCSSRSPTVGARIAPSPPSVYRAAAVYQNALNRVMGDAAAAAGGRCKATEKTVHSIVERVVRKRWKGAYDLEWMSDHVRRAIIAKRAAKFPRVAAELARRGAW